ncbi:histidine kinase [bacterium (candidate division B38) B3_B38]|nr:MAG: histidine kinase [bacterium (candidate division B38) B3_B38]
MSELSGKKDILKELIKRLHEGAKPEEIKEEFREVLKDVTSTEIVQIEEELVKEGMPREEIQRLCEVHLAVFRESLEREQASAPAGHPIHTLMEEHKILLSFADELKCTAGEMKGAKDFDSVSDKMKHLNHLAEHLKESESHYVREENVLFPYLEKHGVTQPPAIMWTEHNKIREMKKNLYSLVDTHKDMAFQDFIRQLEESAVSLADMLSSHFYKENNILFPTALKVITGGEWKDIRHQFDELGYCCFTPEPPRLVTEEKEVPTPKRATEGMIPLETGTFSKDELEAMLNTLPVDITFVDKEDTVRYFSQSKDRIFARTKAVIGRKVQLCHPQQSVHVVNKLLEDFKSGRRDAAAFWINLEGRLIYIRYFAVRSQKGDYLGCLEVSQDITDIKKIKGEKKLL